MKKSIPLFAAMALIFTATIAGASIDPARYGDVVELGEPLTTVSIQHCVVGTENGVPMAYYTVAGDPALFHVVSVNDNQLQRIYELPGAIRSWNHVIAPDGTVYIAGVVSRGSAHLYRYFPEEKRVEDLGAGVQGHRFIWALAAAEDGRIYGGTWEGGHVFEYDPATDKTRDLGRVDPTEDYVRSIAWHDGYVYAGTGTRNGRVWRVDPETGEKVRLELPQHEKYAEHFDRMGSIYHLAVAGDHLFAFINNPRVLAAYDLKEKKWWDQVFPFTGGPVSGVYSEKDHAFYHPGPEDALWMIDLETREQEKLMRFRGGFRGGDFVKVEGLSGETLVTVFGNGSIGLYNRTEWIGRGQKSNARGQAANFQALENGPGGKLYYGSYMGGGGGSYDPVSGKMEKFSMGQPEGIVQFGDRLFWGVYPQARIYEQSPLSGNLGANLLFRVGHAQDRPFAMTADEEKIYIGTIPDYGGLDGALTIFAPDSDGEPTVYENVVSNQSIVGLARVEGTDLLFGSTTIMGGLGIEPTETVAKIFVWDVAEEKKIAEFELDLPGLNSPRMIGGLSFGPDGLVWGAVHGFIFALDPESLEVVKYRNLYPNRMRYGHWRPVYLRWSDDCLLYANVAGHLTAIDPTTLEHLDLGVRSGLFAIGGDGNLYFANGPVFKMIPIDEGRAAAGGN